MAGSVEQSFWLLVLANVKQCLLTPRPGRPCWSVCLARSAILACQTAMPQARRRCGSRGREAHACVDGHAEVLATVVERRYLPPCPVLAC